MKSIRIGTRGSALALWQAHWVEQELRRRHFDVQIVEINTSGDKNRQGAIANLGAEGVFTKEIQRALLVGDVDLAVHSLKDLPTESVVGLEFVASPRRGAFRDAFVSTKAKRLEELPNGASIGTGSVRRKAQILHYFGTRFKITDIRGNVETRLHKLDAGEFDAIILAEAGLTRLALQNRITSLLKPPMFLPAIGQGTLGIEIRADDAKRLQAAVDLLNDLPTYATAIAERSLLAALRGGCLAPIAALASIEHSTKDMQKKETRLVLTARVFSPDGTQKLEATSSLPISFSQSCVIVKQNAVQLGQTVAKTLLEQDAAKLLER
ncbi:MAG: hydroxymethylbilane synthase [Planctomycetaceae bacterium]|jgi:hydroxymethylbilane synthase|nr:hydroxymethylbilane synthase [Planctomycetaceae bacterium]